MTGALFIVGAFACSPAPAPTVLLEVPVEPVAVPVPQWPAPGTPLRVLKVDDPATPLTVVVDAGHGAPGNSGNTSCTCTPEQDVTLDVASDLGNNLGTGIVVHQGRAGDARPTYPDRKKLAENIHADAIVSIHTDSRGEPDPDKPCPTTDDQPGFSVLWSDEGPDALVAGRHRLAQAIAIRMSEAGFLAYDGVEYTGLYAAEQVPGVFLDRHAPNKRIYMLRRTTLPTVIIELMNAWHPAETARWQEPATRAALAGAVRAALVDVSAPPGGPER